MTAKFHGCTIDSNLDGLKDLPPGHAVVGIFGGLGCRFRLFCEGLVVDS